MVSARGREEAALSIRIGHQRPLALLIRGLAGHVLVGCGAAEGEWDLADQHQLNEEARNIARGVDVPVPRVTKALAG